MRFAQPGHSVCQQDGASGHVPDDDAGSIAHGRIEERLSGNGGSDDVGCRKQAIDS